MKRKRHESTRISNKILYLQNGSNVEVQLDDGKWHSAIIIECQQRKYLVQVEEQQYWIDFGLIRPNTIIDPKRNVSFEYRPGQFLRNEIKSINKIVSDEKVSLNLLDSSLISSQIESSNDTKKTRLSRIANIEKKKCSFVWKPSTISTIQTRRSSKSNHSSLISSEENILNDNHSPTRTSSDTIEQTSSITSNNIKPSLEIPSSEVLIFRPIIRFVESSINDQQSNNSISLKHHCSIDDENLLDKDDDYNETLRNRDIIYTTDSRSSSTTSTDNQYDIIISTNEQQIKNQSKSSCFLETPPPSLPDIHLTQESETLSLLDKPLKSKRKQDRPQRKSIEFNHLLFKDKNKKDLSKISNDLSDRGYLSDEYNEPMLSSTNHLLTYSDLQNLLNILEDIFNKNDNDFNSNIEINEENKLFSQQLITYLYNKHENYQKINKYRLQYYNDENNQHIRLISNILQQIFSICYQKTYSIYLFQFIPDEIKKHIQLCLNYIQNDQFSSKKISTRNKSLNHIQIKNNKTTSIHFINQQQVLLSPSNTITSLSKQQSNEHLLSPNNKSINSHPIQQINLLSKEKDIYEIIHCLCHYQIDNGFMIQCETCLCWSHCECVGVTATCIPAFFKCNICTKAQIERTPELSISSIFDSETTRLFLTTSNNTEKVSLFLSYSQRLWNLREQMIELKFHYTPLLRSLQYALRCDDLIELFHFANIKSDELIVKIERRIKNREYFQSIAYTIDDILDSVCSSISNSSCLSIELSNKNKIKRYSLNDQINILICHLCDDEDIQQIRLSIQKHYNQLISIVDNKIQIILLEHRNIETQMAFELGIIPENLSNDYLSYHTHQLALRTAIEQLKY